MGVRRHKAEAGGEFVGALQSSSTLFETGMVIPEIIFKDRIALDSLPAASAFLPLEYLVELHATFSQ
jgi:hypothetical protein